MSTNSLLEDQYEETRLIISELLDDGSDPNALYIIEHHLAATNFDVLEKMAVEAFKLGYEVSDAEESELEDGSTVICCDVISESPLNAELIDDQVEQLFKLAEHHTIDYDGWGTYYEDPNRESDDEENDNEILPIN